MQAAAIAVLLGTLVWVLGSERFSRWSVTAPILLTLLGLGYSASPWAPDSPVLEAEPVKVLVEVTLALVLFTDASHIGARWFADRPARTAGRLLAIGLPLTIALGLVVALPLFPALPWAVLAVTASALAPTDAALGASVMADERIPLRLREVINVESGLNDGLATPVVLFFLAIAAADEGHASVSEAVLSAAREIGIAVAVGLALGWLGGRLVILARQRGWSSPEQEPIATVAVALMAYTGSLLVGGNGFVAAFVGGVGFGTALAAARPPHVMVFSERVGLLLSFVVWFIFGAGFIPLVVGEMPWEALLYGVLSLTVVRMLPVAVSLIGSGTGRDDVLMLGWLGPRGLASIVFALIALDELGKEAVGPVLGLVTVTVTLSVLAHGLSAGPLATWYSRRHPEPASAPSG